MGADMFILYIVFDEGTDFLKEKQKILDLINEVDFNDKDTTDYIINHSNIGNYLQNCDDLKSKFIRITENMFSSLINEDGSIYTSRDIDFIIRNKEIMFVTGGMAWGDAPTDSYDIFDKYTQMCWSMGWPLGKDYWSEESV